MAGPIEATATGNAAVQLMSLGEVENLRQAREMVARSIDLKQYQPVDQANWDAHYDRYLTVTGQK